MKKPKIAAIATVLALIFSLSVYSAAAGDNHGADADNDIVYRYTYVNNVYNSFDIENGTAKLNTHYYAVALPEIRAEISITLQHRFLFWWSDVSGGTWNDTVYGSTGGVEHSLALSQYGDFRAVINVKVYGSGSDYDEIDQTLYDSN